MSELRKEKKMLTRENVLFLLNLRTLSYCKKLSSCEITNEEPESFDLKSETWVKHIQLTHTHFHHIWL